MHLELPLADSVERLSLALPRLGGDSTERRLQIALRLPCRQHRIHSEATHPDHKLVRSLLPGDPPLGAFEATVDVLELAIGARQLRHVIAVIECRPEPP